MKKIILIFAFIMVVILLQKLRAQSISQDTSDYIYKSKYGYRLPASDTIRVLVVFAEVNWDINPNSDPDFTGTIKWPKHQLPRWKDSLFDANYLGYGNEIGKITKYYSKASSGKYIVLGDYLVNPNNGGCFTINRSSYVAPSNIHTPICQNINSNMSQIVTGHGLNNINYFNNWECTDLYMQKNKPHINHPKRYDDVIFIIRNCELQGEGYSFFGEGSFLGYSIETDCICGVSGGNMPTSVTRHEYAHHIYGSNEFHAGGGGYAPGIGQYFISIDGGYSNMGLYNSSLLCWNGWDRQRMDWTAVGNIYNPSARNVNNTSEVNGEIDASIPSGAGIYWLRDFVTTGDALKIKLPFIPSNQMQQWLWIENHNTITKNNNEFDQFQFQQQFPCVQDAAYGLYMYKQVERDLRIANDPGLLMYGYAYYLKPILADGNFDYQFENTPVQNDCVADFPVYAFSKLTKNNNPLTGGCDWGNIAIDNGTGVYNQINNSINNILQTTEGIAPTVEKIGNQYHKNLFSNGHTRNAFTFTGNKKISIGTNPSSANVETYTTESGNLIHIPISQKQNVRKIYLNGVSVEILEQTNDGNIKVRVRFDDVDIDNDIRWCADTIETTPVVTSTGFSLNLKANKIITIDLGKTATRVNNPLLIEGEKVFASPTVFRVMPNTFFNMENGSKLVIDNGSTLKLESNSRIDMGEDAQIIVKKGSKMIMNSNSLVKAGYGAKIIVEPSGQLIVDGALITSKENNVMWQGIEVEGDPNQPLTEEYQGSVLIKNGATIENAMIGVHCVLNAYIPAKSSQFQYASGGIIKAYYAVFKNNQTAVQIEHWFASGSDYNSNINYCTFEYPKAVDPNLDITINYIRLNGVKNVNIIANAFNGNSNNAYNIRGIAIEAHDATFILKNPNPELPTPNTFTNMTYGIACYNTNPYPKPEIVLGTFNDCWRAIYLGGATDAKVLKNTINYKSQSTDPLCKSYGIYLDNCNKYQVEGNLLSASKMDSIPENGIVVNNSGTEYNRVYRNTFTYIQAPLFAQNINRNSSGTLGLEILCNNIIECNVNDIVVTYEDYIPDPNATGIKMNQGKYNEPPITPAANLFTSGNKTYVNYINKSPNIVFYARYHDLGVINYQGFDHLVTPKIKAVNPNISLQDTWILWNETNWVTNYCKDSTGLTPGGVKSMNNMESFKQQIGILQYKIDSANAALLAKMDNGNTQQLVNRINTCPATAYGKLYSDMRKYSPYLSEEALLAIIQKQGFQTSLLVNLMLVNTHVAKTPMLLDALQGVQPPLSTNQMNQIRNKYDVFSVMELDRMKLSNVVVQRDNIYNAIESFYAHDSIPSSNDSLSKMLQRDPRLTAKYELVYHYLANKDSLNADLLVNEIPQLYNLDANAQTEYNKYKQLYDLKRTLQREGKNFNELSEEQQQLLLNVINHPSLSIGEMNDLNALRQVNDVVVGKMAKTRGKNLVFEYNEPIVDLVVSKNMLTDDLKETSKEELQMEGLIDEVLMSENGLKLYPNPAVDIVNIYYHVMDNAKNISIEIYDITGRNAGTYAIDKNNNLLKLNTQFLKKGIYYVMLLVDGNKKVEKLIIQ